jgi:hypothetical protein
MASPMSKIHRTRGFPISVERKEIARYVGYGGKRVPQRVQRLMNDVQAEGLRFLDPAYAYRRMEREDLSHSGYLRCADAVVLCLVTIGGRLEAAAEEHRSCGDLSRALLIDAFGSAAVEAAADAAEAAIKADVGRAGHRCSKRFSPGYGRWDVAEQRWIVPALEGDALQVTLTEGLMMVPRKSITFAVTYGIDVVKRTNGDVCEVCGMPNCRFRRPARRRSTKEGKR